MQGKILIFQVDRAASRPLEEYFIKHGDRVWVTTEKAEAEYLYTTYQPQTVFVDLHTPGSEWSELASALQSKRPAPHIILTNRVPDVMRELQAKNLGLTVFLRAPFTPEWIGKALQRSSGEGESALAPMALNGQLPRVRVPILAKITLPYALLAVIFALVATFLFSRFMYDSVHQRFLSQLVDAGRLSQDWMVNEENRMLTSLRQVANTEGMGQALAARDSDTLRLLALPILANQQEDALELLGQDGGSVLSLYHVNGGGPQEYQASQGSTALAALPFIQQVIQGRIDQGRDKYAGLANVDGVDYFFVAGPVFDSQGQPAGAILIGNRLDNLVRQNRQDTLAQITLYDNAGKVLASTLLSKEMLQPLPPGLIQEVTRNQDQSSILRGIAAPLDQASQPTRGMELSSGAYSELLAPFEVRNGEDLGVVGISLAENYLVQISFINRVQLLLIGLIAFFGVIVIGIALANQVTRPLSQVVQASSKVAQGNLEVKVPSGGNDEVAVLASAFNYMVSHLQEGFIYRDLLGRSVSPEVREALRKSFSSGDLQLEGQSAVATVLMTDIRGFTTISEAARPATVITWLNEYFGELVPVVTRYGGVVDKFEGDAMLSFFGILPTPLSPQESARDACQAAVELLAVINAINLRRQKRGDPPLITGISLNTGDLTAGGLGTADRFNYTIIGDTVNTTQRLQDMTRGFGASGIVISENTLSALDDLRSGFNFVELGARTFPGKQKSLQVYRLLPKAAEALPEQPA